LRANITCQVAWRRTEQAVDDGVVRHRQHVGHLPQFGELAGGLEAPRDLLCRDGGRWPAWNAASRSRNGAARLPALKTTSGVGFAFDEQPARRTAAAPRAVRRGARARRY